jgi:molybdopterin/thiamine biosynthesis adenylyltransferase
MDPLVHRITVVGVGGTGCALLPLLVGLGPIQLTLVDGDTVEATNLPRQPLFGPADTGRVKVEVAAERMQAIAPHVRVTTVPRFLDATNAQDLVQASTIVLDATDDLHAKHLLDRTCRAHRVPLITGSVHGHQIQVVALHVDSGSTGIGLGDLFAGRSSPEQDACDMRAVPVHITALCASVMAMHARALVLGDHSLAGHVDLIDPRTGRWLRIAAPVAPHDDELIAQGTSSTLRT